MNPEFGHFTLALALPVALVQACIPLIGAQRRDAALMAVAGPAAILQMLLIGTAFAALTHAFIVSDFSVINVFENSHTAKPLLYKISGVWGNHEGSLVLWVLILAIFGATVAAFGKNLPDRLKSRALSVQGMIGAGFLAFILFTSNPFLRLDPAPAQGQGLNPLLQDPGLALHPPMLYLGYVGFSMAFSFAIAALLEGRVDAAWARWVRPWTLAAWSSLTLGIGLGSWWAYYELGWGGWWFWDPVENASFIPWLTGTALLHSAIVVEKREALKSWTILLAIVTFSLSLLGTFLVRSGILTSVHAFAADPTRGVFILALLSVAVGGSLILYAVRAPAMEQGGLFAPISREGSLLINNLFLATAAATVLLGTLYPLIAEALELGKLSVGAPYFNTVFVPLMVPLAILMGIGPLMTWKRSDLKGVFGRLRTAIAAVVLAFTVAIILSGTSMIDVAGSAGMGLAAWLAASTLFEWMRRVHLFKAPLDESWRRAKSIRRASYGMTIAHLGMSFLIAGVSGSSAWKQENILEMMPGDSITVAGFNITLDGADVIRGANYESLQGNFTAIRKGKHITLTPERRVYDQPIQQTTEAAIHTTFWADLYLVLGDGPDESGQYVVRVYFEPFVPFLWYGVLLMGFGGATSLSDRKHRIGAARTSERIPEPARIVAGA
ncbi:MAG: heme lyase CcmF/NrfE family subunit [Rhodospirillaceae bacterium]